MTNDAIFQLINDVIWSASIFALSTGLLLAFFRRGR